MLEFSGAGIRLTVDAADGGRITQLFAHGRAWLAPSHPRSGEESYGAAGTGGWDEVAPTVQACELPDGVRLLDHGDAWRTPWTVLLHDDTTLAMAVELPTRGVRLERVIRASARGVRLEYRASTPSRVPVPLLWCGHPLFDASDGARIVASGALTGEYPVRGIAVDWPAAIGQGKALKAFASGVTTAAVEAPDGASLELSWDLPHVGFYWDGGEFSDGPVIAIEPSTGASDSAARAESLPTVVAGQPLSWWVAVDSNP